MAKVLAFTSKYPDPPPAGPDMKKVLAKIRELDPVRINADLGYYKPRKQTMAGATDTNHRTAVRRATSRHCSGFAAFHGKERNSF